MTTRRTVRLDESLDSRLEDYTKSANLPASEVIREALKEYLDTRASEREETIGERLRRTGLLGKFKTGVKDLSTNPKYMQGFGE